jgi:hypothetical protein
MNDCSSSDSICRLKPDYARFDELLKSELCLPYSAKSILNESNFCVRIDLNATNTDILSQNDYLEGVGGKIGVYHLWIDMEDACGIHDSNRMLAVYVGKGIAQIRLKDHLKNKWPQTETAFISFFECENRVAKYLEQLFLDIYKFELNTNENPGSDYLHGFWDAHRYDNGTETQRLGDMLVDKLGLEDEAQGLS